jgi:hypothetical protein
MYKILQVPEFVFGTDERYSGCCNILKQYEETGIAQAT